MKYRGKPWEHRSWWSELVFNQFAQCAKSNCHYRKCKQHFLFLLPLFFLIASAMFLWFALLYASYIFQCVIFSRYTNCGIPKARSWNIFRPHYNLELPWPGMIFGITINSLWYFCCDQVTAMLLTHEKILIGLMLFNLYDYYLNTRIFVDWWKNSTESFSIIHY